MTVEEFLADIEKLKHKPTRPDAPSIQAVMRATTDIWSNDACKGYCAAAAHAAGLTPGQIDALCAALCRQFDDLTVDEAERIGADV